MEKPPLQERKRILQPHSQTNVNRPLSHPEILRQIDEADSLLQILSGRTFTAVPTSPRQELQRTQSEGQGVRAIEFTIRPKNDTEVIEELQIVNSNLRALVDKASLHSYI